MRGPLPLVVRLLSGFAVAVGLLAAAANPAVAVGGGYGPVGPDPATSLGLNVPVLSARALDASGGVVEATDRGRTVRLAVPAGWLGGPTQVAILRLTEEAGMALAGNEYSSGWAYVTGYGVSLQPLEGASSRQAPAPAQINGQLALEVSGHGLVRADDVALRVRGSAVLDLPVTPGDVLSATLNGPAAVLLLRPAADSAPRGSHSPEVRRPAGDSTALPRTGADPVPLLVLGAGLLLVGAGAAAGAARRRSHG